MVSSMQRLFGLGLVSSLAAASHMQLFGLESRQTDTSNITCAAGIHLMIAPGCHLPCVNHGADLMTTLMNDIENAVPGSDAYIVPYDNSTTQAKVSTIIMVQQAIQYFETCPNTPVVFLGYSLGGIIVMNTLCGGVSSSYVPNVLAAVNYGEETFVYPASYDQGTCQMNAPLYARSNTAACAPFAPVIQDYCDATDPQCCTGGTDNSTHFDYAQNYDSAALAFVLSKYSAWTSAHASTSSSTMVSTSTMMSAPSTSLATTTTGTVYSNSTASSAVSTSAPASTTSTVTATATSTRTISSVSGAELMTITFTYSGSTITATAAVPTYYPSVPLTGAVEESTNYPSSYSSLYSSGLASVSSAQSASSAAASSAASSAAAASSSKAASAGSTATGSSGSASSAASGSASTATSASGSKGTSSPSSATSAASSPSVSPYKGAASQLTMPASGAFRFIAKALRTVAVLLI